MFFVLHYYCILVAPIMLLNFKNGLEKIMDFTKLSTYNYHLPEELIAQSPEEKRDNSRLLTINKENGKTVLRFALGALETVAICKNKEGCL